MTRNELIKAANNIADKADQLEYGNLYGLAMRFSNDLCNEPTKATRANGYTCYTVSEGRKYLSWLKKLLKEHNQ